MLEQINKNTSNLSDLHERVEYKVSKHVDIREALLNKKDEQLEHLQMQMNKRIESELEEQKKLRELIESLEQQLRNRESDIKDREKQILIQKEDLESEHRKFNVEKEITFSRLKEGQTALKLKQNALDRAKKEFQAAIELEHRSIISMKMKLAVQSKINQTLRDDHDDINGTEYNNPSFMSQNELVQIEMNALAEAFKEEESKLVGQKEVLKKKEEKLKMTQQTLRQKEKVGLIFLTSQFIIFWFFQNLYRIKSEFEAYNSNFVF